MLKYFDIKTVSFGILVFGGLWLLSLKEKSIQSVLFPLFYILVAISAFLLNDFLVLKFLPLLISLAFILFLILSYFHNNSILLHFARKIHKHPLGIDEEAYIHRCTIFLDFTLLLECLFTCRHFTPRKQLLLDYLFTSFGWYMVFVIGGFMQFLHRKFIFFKGNNIWKQWLYYFFFYVLF